MWGLAFDLSQLVNGIVFDVIIAAFLTIINYQLGIRTEQRRMRGKFSLAAGIYTGHKTAENATIDPEVISNSVITYRKDNHLSIRLTHKAGDMNLTWEGDIAMEMETFGVIVWRYVDFPKRDGKDVLWFGFKRIMVREFEKEVHVYLIGEQGFGNEILVRKK